MDRQTQTFSGLQVKPVRKSCYKCGSIRETSGKTCAVCGKTLETVLRIRFTGAVQIILGGGLLVFMSGLAFRMLDADTNNHFHGGANDVLFIIFIFALVGSISLGTLVAGVWQIIFGKRNKLLMVAMILLGIVFAMTGFGVLLNK